MKHSYPEIRVLPANPSMKGLAHMIPDVVFACPEGIPLKMQLLCPWAGEAEGQGKKFPLIVFVQGSAWQFPDVYVKIPQLSAFAQAGYAVATVTHRNCVEGHPFPAYLQDVKTAVRFLRAHAEEYRIDPERVAVWGTSSGGNTALLLGVTGDDPQYKTEEWQEYSDSVKAVVDCFGPADLESQMRYMRAGETPELLSVLEGLRGENTEENQNRLREMDPKHHLRKGRSYPPFFLLHGDRDDAVPYEQSEQFFHTLIDWGVEASMLRVEGAPHEGSFWSQPLLQCIREFLDAHV